MVPSITVGSVVIRSDAPAQRFDVTELIPDLYKNGSGIALFTNGDTTAAPNMQVWAESQVQGERKMFACTSRQVNIFRLNYTIIYF